MSPDNTTKRKDEKRPLCNCRECIWEAPSPDHFETINSLGFTSYFSSSAESYKTNQQNHDIPISPGIDLTCPHMRVCNLYTAFCFNSFIVIRAEHRTVIVPPPYISGTNMRHSFYTSSPWQQTATTCILTTGMNIPVMFSSSQGWWCANLNGRPNCLACPTAPG